MPEKGEPRTNASFQRCAWQAVCVWQASEKLTLGVVDCYSKVL